MELKQLAHKANKSWFWRLMLNLGLWHKVPFNRPHALWVKNVDDHRVEVDIPWRRINQNHIRTLHACAMATASEYASGLFLLNRLGNTYRLIMESFNIEFHYRGEGKAKVSFVMSEEDFISKVQKPLESNGVVTVEMTVLCHDIHDDLLSTCVVRWQLKDWKLVGQAR